MHRKLRSPAVLAALAVLLLFAPSQAADTSQFQFDSRIGLSGGAEMAEMIATGKAPRVNPASLGSRNWSGLRSPKVTKPMTSATTPRSRDARDLPVTDLDTIIGGPVYEAMDFDDNATETSGSIFIPPDPIGAAGPNGLLAVTNVMIEMLNKDGTLRFRDSLQDFFTGTTNFLGTFTFDPKVLYDPYEDRFVVVTLERQFVSQGAASDESRILLAVSKTNDPATATGADWWFAGIDSKLNISGADHWADYPGFEVDEEAIYITNNMVNFATSIISGPRLWIVDKGTFGGFYAGGAISFSVEDPVTASGGLATTLMPAQVFDAGGVAPGVGTFLVGYDGLTLGGPGGNEAVQVIRIDDPLGSPVFTLDLPFVGDLEDIGGAFGFPPIPDAPQSGTATLLEVNDRRALDAVVRNGSLYFVTTIDPRVGVDAGQATAHWFQLDVSVITSSASPGGLITLADQGDIGGEDIGVGTSTSFPAIAVNSIDEVKIGFAASNANIFPGVYVTGRQPGDPAGTMQPTATVRTGDDYYVRTFGGPRNRWGDYTGMSVDPVDDRVFWVFSQYAMTRGTPTGSEDGRWATVWGQCTFEPAIIETPPPFLTKWGTSGSGQGQFDFLQQIAVNDCGEVYAADAVLNRIQKFDEDGNFLLEWGSTGSGNGEFDNPVGVAIDGLNNVYVVDAQNDRVQKFDENGNYLLEWGTTGSGNGEFDTPAGIAVSPTSGQVYVADFGNDRVQLFDQGGTYVSQFGSTGSGDGQFTTALYLTVDESGNVYVADEGLNRVQKFDAAGSFLLKWGSTGSLNGQFSLATGLASDRNGGIYVTDLGNSRVQKFSTNGDFLTKWGTFGSGDGQFDTPVGIAVDPRRDQIYVSDRGNDRIQKFGTTNNGVLPFVLEWGTTGTAPGEFNFPVGIDVDNAANVFVIDSGNDRVQKFNADGSFILEWGSMGAGQGQFEEPQGIAVDPTGSFVYVSDGESATAYRIQKFDSNGNFVLEWGVTGSAPGEFDVPVDLEVDSNGDVYVTDLNNSRIQKFDDNGNFLLEWGTSGSGPGEFTSPIGITVDPSGDVYVSDSGIPRIQKFDSSGNYLLEWGTLGIGPGQFNFGSSLAADGSGNIYVGDFSLNRVQVFDASGNYIGQWGCRGTQPAQFDGITLAGSDTQGDLYVVDSGNDRVQRFGNGVVDVAQDGQTPRSFLLHPSIPNPTRGTSLIAFDLPKPSSVSLSIYDVRGRMVRSAYENTAFAAGSHRWTWDGRDASGSRVSAGIYFYSLVTEQGTEARKLVVVE